MSIDLLIILLFALIIFIFIPFVYCPWYVVLLFIRAVGHLFFASPIIIVHNSLDLSTGCDWHLLNLQLQDHSYHVQLRMWDYCFIYFKIEWFKIELKHSNCVNHFIHTEIAFDCSSLVLLSNYCLIIKIEYKLVTKNKFVKEMKKT